ncbi:uncharacterized protein O3C94_010211 [Discoglossus pictus]
MSLSQWFGSIFSSHRQTSSHLHLLNESQPLQDLQSPNQVELRGAHPIGEQGFEEAFQEKISNLGGRESILLVGEAGYSSENDGGYSGILQELSFALFQSPEKGAQEANEGGGTLGEQRDTEINCFTSKAPSKCRIIQFPVILVIFRVTVIMDLVNTTLIKEVLKDIKVRTRDSGSALVGIVYSYEELSRETKAEAVLHFGQLIGQVFRRQAWGVCYYVSSSPDTILEVKRTIMETADVEARGPNQEKPQEASKCELERSFMDLVSRFGGKEQFLMVGNICPSARPSEKAGVFKELARALFGDDVTPSNSSGVMRVATGRDGGSSTDCTRLPKPRSFPYPLILVVFRSTFLKEEVNRPQVKEILVDIKLRAKRPNTQVIGVICSLEELNEEEWQRCRSILYKLLNLTLGGPVGVCSFVRSKPESVREVKRCMCDFI